MTVVIKNAAQSPRQKVRGDILYHVSPNRNRSSILVHGLEPSLFSKDRQKKIWLVEWKELMWAIMHTARRHGVDPIDCDVWIIHKSALRRLQKTAFRDVFQTPCRIEAKVFMTAQHALLRYEAFLENVTKTPGV